MSPKSYFRELTRPWKLITFSLTFAWLIYGAFEFKWPGWNPGVSVILGLLAYTTAPLAMRAIREGVKAGTFAGFVRAIVALGISAILSVGVYYGYNTLMAHPMLLPESLIVTFAAYIATGIFWAWRGTVAEFTKLDGREYIENYIHSLVHEMKSPLTALIGAAELIDEDLPPKDRAKLTANIREQSQRLKEMMDKLLALAKLEGQSELENPVMVDMHAIVNMVIADFAVRLQQRRITCRNMIPLESQTMGEPFLLRQAIANLLDNAIDFSPDGGHVSVSVESKKMGLTLVMQDQGSGIPDYALPRLFERFYSLSRPGTLRKGTGLGLSFVREVAILHKGDVVIINRKEHGAEARLTLRLE